MLKAKKKKGHMAKHTTRLAIRGCRIYNLISVTKTTILFFPNFCQQSFLLLGLFFLKKNHIKTLTFNYIFNLHKILLWLLLRVHDRVI